MVKKMTKETKTTNENKKMPKRANFDRVFKIIEIVLKFIPIVVSIVALSVSIKSYNNTRENDYYSRMFQPLNYYYDFTIDNEQTDKFGQYYMPIITCHIKVTSGCISKTMMITTDENAIDSVYDYNSKLLEIELTHEMEMEFDLKFSSIAEFENCVYQYIFIYVEGTNNEWNLDCLEVKYNENQTIEHISILDTNDLLRKNTENDEIQSLILDDYEMVFNEIKNFNL